MQLFLIDSDKSGVIAVMGASQKSAIQTVLGLFIAIVSVQLFLVQFCSCFVYCFIAPGTHLEYSS